MSKVSTVTVEGFAATTPEVRTTGGGKRVAEVVVYHTRRRKSQSGQWEDAGPATVYVAALWDEQADIAASIQKGTPVVMWGVPEVEAYLKGDGTAAAKVKLLYATVAVLAGGQQARQQAPSQAFAPAPAWDTAQPANGAPSGSSDAWGAPDTTYNDGSPF